jgi:putative ABC transport system substrate-binding protein
MNKIICIMLGALLFALCFSAEAQQTGKVPRIGYVAPLSPASESGRIDAFSHGLRDLGYIEGKNIRVEYRYAEGKPDRIPALVGELVELKVDVLVAEGLSATRVAQKLTKMIPIITITSADLVAAGIVDSWHVQAETPQGLPD